MTRGEKGVSMNTFIISTMVMGGLIFGFVLGVAFTLWQTEMRK